MPLITWDNASPAGTDGIAQGDDKIRETRLMVSERFSPLFPNWLTPGIDRIVQRRTFVDGTNGLTFRNETDTDDLLRIHQTGFIAEFKAANCILYDGVGSTPLVGPTKFANTPTEIYDVHAMHNPATPWRIVIPAGFDGIYFVTIGASVVCASNPLNTNVGVNVTKNGVAQAITSMTVGVAANKSHTLFTRLPISLVGGDYLEPMMIGDLTVVQWVYSGLFFGIERA